jgi:hypothetical protein
MPPKKKKGGKKKKKESNPEDGMLAATAVSVLVACTSLLQCLTDIDLNENLRANYKRALA